MYTKLYFYNDFFIHTRTFFATLFFSFFSEWPLFSFPEVLRAKKSVKMCVYSLHFLSAIQFTFPFYLYIYLSIIYLCIYLSVKFSSPYIYLSILIICMYNVYYCMLYIAYSILSIYLSIYLYMYTSYLFPKD